jgi:hypothetical protein
VGELLIRNVTRAITVENDVRHPGADFIGEIQSKVFSKDCWGEKYYNSEKLWTFYGSGYKPILLNGCKYACKVGLQNEIELSGTER